MALNVQIEKRLGDFRLEVDFSAEAGEPLALLGASGSGKSLTLRCIAGLERPDRGRISLDGEVLFDSSRRIDLAPQKRRVGCLFQQYALFPHMTVEENIAAGMARSRRTVRSQRREKTAALISAFRLEGLERLLPAQLSGGQQQRTALARLLASEPRVLLLDEPFSALDSFLKWQLEAQLQEAASRFDGPLLWVSHDWGEACRNCAWACVLDRGRSSPAAAFPALLADPRTVSAARISGCENLAPAGPGPEPGTASVPAWGLVLRTAASWRESADALGVRACHLRPAGEGAANAFPCRVIRTAEDASGLLVLLRPEGAAEGALPLRMELPREQRHALPDRERMLAAVRPEHVLLLEGGHKGNCAAPLTFF